jgi:putative FmdB family regulatory protein
MPFYEYECASCKYYTEVMQKITDTPLAKCPSCGKKTLKKLVSAPVFRLKGGGWYETDFKSDKEGKRNLAGPDKDDSPSKTESTPASAKADTAKGETVKSESPKSESKSEGGSGRAAETKSSSGSAKRGKAPVAAARTASKSKPAASRSKTAARPARKKGRR